MGHQSFSLQRSALWRTALIASLYKLDPRVQFRNPVMFVVYLGSILTTCLAIAIASGRSASRSPSACGSGSRSCSPTLLKRCGRAQQSAGGESQRH